MARVLVVIGAHAANSMNPLALGLRVSTFMYDYWEGRTTDDLGAPFEEAMKERVALLLPTDDGWHQAEDGHYAQSHIFITPEKVREIRSDQRMVVAAFGAQRFHVEGIQKMHTLGCISVFGPWAEGDQPLPLHDWLKSRAVGFMPVKDGWVEHRVDYRFLERGETDAILK
jgi:hypothetical protein